MVVGAFLLLEKIEIVAADFIACDCPAGNIKALNLETVLRLEAFLDFSGKRQ